MKKYLSLLFLLSLLPLNGNGQSDEKEISQSPSIVTLVYMEGMVQVDGNQAEEGQIISNGSIVETGSDSYCELIFAQKNIIRVQENTLTTISVEKGQIALEKGSMAFLLEKLEVLGIGNKDFTITTPLTTAGIRGTAFFIKVESPESVYFCNCNGVIQLSDIEGGNSLTLESERHRAVRYMRKSGKIKQSEAPLLYHDDDEMDDLASKINHTIPWGTLKNDTY